MSRAPASSPILIDAQQLGERLSEVRLVDVRWYLDGRSGRDAYLAGHLPGAVFCDLDTDLASQGPPTKGRHPLPAPEQFARALSLLGIREDEPVVAYDDTGGGTAGRLVWMLRSLGEDAALLDGGIASWPDELETGAVELDPAPRRPKPWPSSMLTDLQSLDDLGPSTQLLDARATERYRGDLEPVDPRAGHIPQARTLPWTELLDERGRFRPPAAIRERFADVGVGDASSMVASCGSGVTACALLIAAAHAQLGCGQLFVPSFSGWSSDPTRTVVTGD